MGFDRTIPQMPSPPRDQPGSSTCTLGGGTPSGTFGRLADGRWDGGTVRDVTDLVQRLARARRPPSRRLGIAGYAPSPQHPRDYPEAARRPAWWHSSAAPGKPFPMSPPTATWPARSVPLRARITYPVAPPRSTTAAIPGPRRRLAPQPARGYRATGSSHEIANAVMHTTVRWPSGGGTRRTAGGRDRPRGHAPRTSVVDLGEAPGQAPARDKSAPRGVSLLIGCATFPHAGTTCSFASLARCGQASSRRAVLPLAITVVDGPREGLGEAFSSPHQLSVALYRRRRVTPGSPPWTRALAQADRLHRVRRVRDVARRQTPKVQAVRREVGRADGRHRLHRRLPRLAVKPCALAVAVQRPDVHHPGARRRRRRSRSGAPDPWPPTVDGLLWATEACELAHRARIVGADGRPTAEASRIGDCRPGDARHRASRAPRRGHPHACCSRTSSSQRLSTARSRSLGWLKSLSGGRQQDESL